MPETMVQPRSANAPASARASILPCTLAALLPTTAIIGRLKHV
nr:hypothetical protein [Chitinasiproducens palmae]